MSLLQPVPFRDFSSSRCFLFILIAAVRPFLLFWLAQTVSAFLHFIPFAILPKRQSMFGFIELRKRKNENGLWRRVCSVPYDCSQTERQISFSLREIPPSSQVSRIFRFALKKERSTRGSFYESSTRINYILLTYEIGAINDDYC